MGSQGLPGEDASPPRDKGLVGAVQRCLEKLLMKEVSYAREAGSLLL